MTCRNFALLTRLRPALPQWLHARLEAHSHSCDTCRSYGRRLEALPGLLREAYRQEVQAYAPATELRWIPAQSGSPFRIMKLWPALALAGGAACAALLMMPRPHSHIAAVSPQPAPVSHKPEAPKDLSPLPQPRHMAVVPDRPTRISPRETAPPPRPVQLVADDQYLDGRDAALDQWWRSAGQPDPDVARLLSQPLPPMRDDFVQPPLPRLEDASGKTAAEAVQKYEQEAKVVDARLFRKVTLALKAVSIDEFCAEMTKQTGVALRSTRGVADEKVTIFVDERPARDVMREVARLFGYLWGRVGEEGHYKYDLEQDLRSQLAEEELRSKDVHAALIALDEKLADFKPFLERSPEQIRAEYERIKNDQSKKDEQGRLFHLFNGAYGPLALYYRLSPKDRSELFRGELLRFSADSTNPDRHLPDELLQATLKSSNLAMFPSGTIIQGGIFNDKPSKPVDELPGAVPEALLKLDRSEAGEFSLEVGTYVYVKENGNTKGAGGFSYKLASGRSPSTSRPDNAAANAALKKDPLFQKKISFKPEPSCPRLKQPESVREEQKVLYEFTPEFKQAHVNSADVWEEAHKQTGLPIVADSYTHLYLLPKVSQDQGSAFDALCRAGDELGVRWRKDGDFLLARSTGFFWDKLKEVPNRLLAQWKADSERSGGVPLEDLLQMAQLSDEQLGSQAVGLGITHCWGLDEWGIIGGGPFIGGEIVPEEMRKRARGLLLLTPAELKASCQENGLDVALLPPARHQAFSDAIGGIDNTIDGRPEKVRFKLDYVPSGSYFWQPTITREQWEAGAKNWPLVYGRKKDDVLAAARRIDPHTEANSVAWTRGRLVFTTIRENGNRWSTVGPRVLAPLE